MKDLELTVSNLYVGFSFVYTKPLQKQKAISLKNWCK